MESKTSKSVPDLLLTEAGSEPFNQNFGITSTVLTGQNFIAQDGDQPVPIVDNLIYERTLNVLVGPPKAGKSTVTRNIIKCIVDTVPFLNQYATPCTVLYIPADEPTFLCKQSLRKMNIQNLDTVLITRLEESTSPLADILKICKESNVKLVVIDLMVKAVKFTESNTYEAVMEAFRPFREAAEEYGIAFLFLHHSPKSNQQSVLGSQAIAGVMDNIMYLTIGKEKSRFFETDGRFSTIEKVELLLNDETDTIIVDEYYGLSDQDAVLHALNKFPHGLSKSATATETKRQKDRVLKVMADMEQKGLISDVNGKFKKVFKGFRSLKKPIVTESEDE